MEQLQEIVAALTANCNIIPIIDNFTWPEPEKLPEDMRTGTIYFKFENYDCLYSLLFISTVCHFNGVRWIHDYQDACVDKLERLDRLTN